VLVSRTIKRLINGEAMKLLKVALLMSTLFAVTAHAEPVAINAMDPGATAYSLFVLDAKKVKSPKQALSNLAAKLVPLGLAPCQVGTDRNYTPIKCPGIEFGANEMYTYNLEINLQKMPVTLDRGIKQVFGVNFRSPAGLIPGDSVGRVVHVHFPNPRRAVWDAGGQRAADRVGQ
jgi:hypothetical protein